MSWVSLFFVHVPSYLNCLLFLVLRHYLMSANPVNASVFADERLLFEPVAAHGNALEVIFAFPNTYSVGITSLGYQVVWATLAMREDISVSRLFYGC